jgi:prepilin-type N-terminal cleavage/methylation domain-containing protein
MKQKKNIGLGFTLMELLIVIAIISKYYLAIRMVGLGRPRCALTARCGFDRQRRMSWVLASALTQ